MDTIVHADIFFFVTTIAVIICVILVSVMLFYLIGILRDVKKTTATINHKIEEAEEDIDNLKQKIAESAVFNFIFAKKKKRKR